MNASRRSFGMVLVCSLFLVCSATGYSATVSGELKQWHKVTLTFDGTNTSESATPNPFTDYRLNVTFSHAGSGKSYVVPGYYAADGNAAETSATSGNKWAVHFAPDEVGEWTYAASFRTGSNVAVDASPTAGSSAGFCDGAADSFTIAASDKTGRDHRGKGRLQYVGEHYLRFAESGEYFLKQGSDSPEGLLAYEDFDNTPDLTATAPRKSWAPHAGDWNAGDPSWQGGKGTELIGAVNYMASEGMNAMSFLTDSAGGDTKNVFMWLGTTDYQHYDVSKCGQWEIVFEHMDKMGIYLHFKTQETENDQNLDGGALGTNRKLYYRELIARFGHHLALNWNLGEENTNTEQQRKDFAQFFYDNDPYHHNIVMHTYPGQQDEMYTPLLGSNSKLTGVSLQGNSQDFSDTPGLVSDWVQNSANAGKPWVVAVDEPGDPGVGIRPDNDAGDSHVDGRKNALWGVILSGGAGCEYYFGGSYAHSDMTCQDFRSRNDWWDYCRYALEFFKNNNVPFWEMINDNSKSSAANDYCFYKAGDVYVVYLKNGGTTTLDLGSSSATFSVQWFDPRNGGSLQNGSVTQIEGPGAKTIGNAPNSTSEDWAILVKLTGSVETYQLTVNSGTGSGSYAAETVVNITANAAPGGQVFDNWVANSGNPVIANTNSASTTLTMPAIDAAVTATYIALVTNKIVASAGANGTISPVGDVWVIYGDNQTFTITASNGFDIADVTTNDVSVGAVESYTFTNVTTAGLTINATFAMYSYFAHITNTVPFTESFEGYTNGFLLAGTNGWYATNQTAGVITTNSEILADLINYLSSHDAPLETNHTKVFGLTNDIANEIHSATGGLVYTDFLTMPYSCSDEPAGDENAQLGLYVNTNGKVAIWHAYTTNGVDFTNEWNILANAPTLSVDESTRYEWTRFTIAQDYSNNMFEVRINGSGGISDAKGWDSGGSNPTGSWFYMVQTNGYMTEFSAAGPAYLDDLAVAYSDAEILWTNGIPEAWLHTYYPTTNDYNAAAMSDTDHDGMLAWEEYVTGTDPTNPASVFVIIDQRYLDGSNYVSWYSTTDSGVTNAFGMCRSTNLTLETPWVLIRTNDIPRKGTGTNIWWDENPPAGVPVFYRPIVVWTNAQ